MLTSPFSAILSENTKNRVTWSSVSNAKDRKLYQINTYTNVTMNMTHKYRKICKYWIGCEIHPKHVDGFPSWTWLILLETVSVVRVCKVRISLLIFSYLYWKRKWKLKVESNLSWVPENKSFCRPQKKITRICEWASGYLQPWRRLMS